MVCDDTCRHQRFQGLLEICVPPQKCSLLTQFILCSLKQQFSQHFCDSFKGIVIQNVHYFTIRDGALKLKKIEVTGIAFDFTENIFYLR